MKTNHKSKRVIDHNHKSKCSSSLASDEVFKFKEVTDGLLKNLDRISRATFSAATALVSMVLAAFSKAFT